MKRFTKIIAPVLAIMIGVSSCDKLPTTTTPTPTPTPTTPTAPTPVTPSVSGTYWGVMVALKMKFNYNVPQLGTPVSLDSDMGIATFYDGAGSSNLVDAGAVSLNSNSLTKQTNNSYSLTATTGMTPSTLNLSSGVQWSVGGGSSTPAINYTHTGSFPDYSGTVDTIIKKSEGLEVLLGSKISGADSVYVVIVTSSQTLIKRVGGNPAPAKATFTAAELSGLPTVTDNSAYLEIVPFKFAENTTGGKKYVYIKETAVLAAVDIN